MVSDDSDWTAFSRHLTRKAGTFDGIANSDGVESKATQVAAYYSVVSTATAALMSVSTRYLVEA